MSGRVWRVVAALGLVAGVVGSMPARPAAAATSRVVLAEMRFNPPHLEITLGDSVLWDAADDGHTVTASDGSFDSSPRGLMAEGDEYRYRFRAPGTYTYFCRVHQGKGMRGEIVVVDPYAPTTTTRLTPVTAAATTTSTATTTTTAPTTTTSRVLATSSSTSPSVATSTTGPSGTPLVPQEPPTLNPDARVVGSPPPDANLPEAQATARRSGDGGSGTGPGVAVFFGVLAVLGAVGGSVLGARGRRRRRRGSRGRRPPA